MPIRTLALLSVLALAAACGSDDYGRVGGTLPTDVSQDSLEVPLPPIHPLTAEVITPLDTVPAPERPAMYIGERAEGGWRGTILLRFDVGDTTVQDKVPLDWPANTRVNLRMKGLVQDVDSAAVVRQVSVHELLAPLDDSALEVEDVSTLLGPEIATGEWLKGETAQVELPLAVVEDWLDAGTHNGIAVVHTGATSIPPENFYSNFAGYAAQEFSASSSRLYFGSFSGGPDLFFEFNDPVIENFEVEIDTDLAHIERDPPGPGDLQIGSWIERRTWLDFDLGPELVPTDATVNSAELVLQFRPSLTMQVRPFSRFGSEANPGASPIDQVVRAWESLREEAGDVAGVQSAWLRGNRRVLDSQTPFNPDSAGRVPADNIAAGELRLDVTEYVQRQVNEIGPDDLPTDVAVGDVGLLIAFTAEQLDLDLGVFYGLDAPDDLKPRLEITYTPPSDTWR